MALDRDDLQTVADMINDSNTQLLKQIQGLLSAQPQAPSTSTTAAAGLDPVTLLAVQSLQAQRNAENLMNRYNQQQQATMLGPFASLSMQDIMMMPEPTRNAIMQSIGTLMSQAPQYPQNNALSEINARLDRIEQQSAMDQWQRARDRSTGKKIAIGAAVVVGGGVIAYGIHKVSSRKHAAREQAITAGLNTASQLLLQQKDK